MFRKRLLAFMIDYFMLCALFCVFYLIERIPFNSNIFNVVYYLSLVVSLFIFFFKDVISGKSVGKRIAKIRVVSKNGKKANVFQLILRNITLPLWQIEGILLLLGKERIGDRIAGTKVVE